MVPFYRAMLYIRCDSNRFTICNNLTAICNAHFDSGFRGFKYLIPLGVTERLLAQC